MQVVSLNHIFWFCIKCKLKCKLQQCFVKGLTYVGEVCKSATTEQKYLSSSVFEDWYDYHAFTLAAHELGHV